MAKRFYSSAADMSSPRYNAPPEACWVLQSLYCYRSWARLPLPIASSHHALQLSTHNTLFKRHTVYIQQNHRLWAPRSPPPPQEESYLPTSLFKPVLRLTSPPPLCSSCAPLSVSSVAEGGPHMSQSTSRKRSLPVQNKSQADSNL